MLANVNLLFTQTNVLCTVADHKHVKFEKRTYFFRLIASVGPPLHVNDASSIETGSAEIKTSSGINPTKH
jgi:hypothetical protein